PAAAGGTSPPLFEAEADERARLLAAEVETDPTGLRIDGGAYGERNVRYGHSVRDLQKALNRQVPIETLRSAGGPLRIDGDYGPRTALFVKAFQRFQELPDTGFADAKTRERLGLTPAGRPPVERGPGLEVFAPAAPREPSPFAGSASNDAAIAKLAQIDGPGRGRYPEANRRYGHSVKLLQASLILSLGHTGLAVDGDYGPKTEEYVKRFQRSEGLRSTGFADPDTRERLGLTDPPLAVLRQRLASRRANERADAERQVDELATEIAARERYVETLFRRLRERTRPTAALR
ncbi:MAG: peptidoglycan-binding domain-containing protein, partial [Planctomycetota bacterium]